MRTPALRRRITVSGVVVLAGVLLVFDGVVYLSLRQGMEQALGELLDARMEVAVRLAEEHGPRDLAARLTQVAVPAQVRTVDGQVFRSEPATPRVGQASPPTTVEHPRIERSIELDNGSTITVYATRAGLDATLRRLLWIVGVGTAVAVLLAAALWSRASVAVVSPLRHMADTAERVTRGRAARRLSPDRPRTELGRLATAFDEMVDAQQSALDDAEAEREATRRFLADAAHQLRTPLAGLRASAEQLLQEEDPHSRDRLLANVVRETARASRLVANLLRIAELEHQPARRVLTDLAGLCEQEADRTRSLVPHLSVDVETAGSTVGEIALDPDGMREAIANLLDNARRHARTSVRVVVSRGERMATVRVLDDGQGVPDADRERIFERFASLDGQGGSGLGLSIAAGVAQAHGGDLGYRDGAFVLTMATTGLSGEATA